MCDKKKGRDDVEIPPQIINITLDDCADSEVNCKHYYKYKRPEEESDSEELCDECKLHSAYSNDGKAYYQHQQESYEQNGTKQSLILDEMKGELMKKANDHKEHKKLEKAEQECKGKIRKQKSESRIKAHYYNKKEHSKTKSRYDKFKGGKRYHTSPEYKSQIKNHKLGHKNNSKEPKKYYKMKNSKCRITSVSDQEVLRSDLLTCDRKKYKHKDETKVTDTCKIKEENSDAYACTKNNVSEHPQNKTMTTYSLDKRNKNYKDKHDTNIRKNQLKKYNSDHNNHQRSDSSKEKFNEERKRKSASFVKRTYYKTKIPHSDVRSTTSPMSQKSNYSQTHEDLLSDKLKSYVYNGKHKDVTITENISKTRRCQSLNTNKMSFCVKCQKRKDPLKKKKMNKEVVKHDFSDISNRRSKDSDEKLNSRPQSRLSKNFRNILNCHQITEPASSIIITKTFKNNTEEIFDEAEEQRSRNIYKSCPYKISQEQRQNSDIYNSDYSYCDSNCNKVKEICDRLNMVFDSSLKSRKPSPDVQNKKTSVNDLEMYTDRTKQRKPQSCVTQGCQTDFKCKCIHTPKNDRLTQTHFDEPSQRKNNSVIKNRQDLENRYDAYIKSERIHLQPKQMVGGSTKNINLFTRKYSSRKRIGTQSNKENVSSHKESSQERTLFTCTSNQKSSTCQFKEDIRLKENWNSRVFGQSLYETPREQNNLMNVQHNPFKPNDENNKRKYKNEYTQCSL